MEWIGCNKCRRPMKGSKRIFSLTQCGHVYCGKCMAGVGTRCPECGTENFTTMILSYPPKLEMTHNYFSSLDDFMEIGLKTAEFQNNQLAVAFRAFREIEEKYENMKKSYWKDMKDMNELMKSYQKLQDETGQLEKIRESLLKTRDGRSMAGRSVTPSFADAANIRTSTCNHNEKSAKTTFTMANNCPNNSTFRTPPQTWNRNVAFSDGSLNSDAYASDSGLSTIRGSATSRGGVFRVPSGQKVPKSVASLQRKTPNFVRISEPKIDFNF